MSRPYDRNNPFEVAAFAYELGSPTSYIDASSHGGVVVWQSRSYCSGCYAPGASLIRQKSDEGKWQFSCTRCGTTSKQCVMRKPQGSTRGTQSYTPSISTLADWANDVDVQGVMHAMKGLSPEARLWFRYSHTSDFDCKSRQKAQTALFTVVIAKINKHVGQLDIADALKFHKLITAVILGYAPGIDMPTSYQFAKIIDVDKAQFYSNRRWSRLLGKIQGLFGTWEGEIEDAFTPFTQQGRKEA